MPLWQDEDPRMLHDNDGDPHPFPFQVRILKLLNSNSAIFRDSYE
jgi:hypothetical protein